MMSYGRALAFLSLLIIAGPCKTAAQFVMCNQPDSFTVQISESQSVVVYGTELLISYNPNVTVYKDPDSNYVEMIVDNIKVQFEGTMVPKVETETVPEKISWTCEGSVEGTGELEARGNDDYAFLRPRLFLITKSNSSHNLLSPIQSKIIGHVKACFASHIYTKVQRVKASNIIINPKSDQAFAVRKDGSDASGNENICLINESININNIMDNGISQFTKALVANNQNKISLPKVKETFKTDTGLFEVNGYFEASDGYLEDMATIKRISDAVVTNDGEKYSVSSDYGLGKLYMEYNHYTMKYGFVEVSGAISGENTGLRVESKMDLVYKQNSCALKVDYIHVAEDGALNLKLTGLGILNNWASKLLTYIAKVWRNEVVSTIETKLTILANEHMHQVNCHKVKDLLSSLA